MRYVELIEFPSGWQPPTFKGLKLTKVSTLRSSVSERGNRYTVYLAKITDDDAIVLRLRDPSAIFRRW